jgi:colanic acid/amylovoran biosynthesis protein
VADGRSVTLLAHVLESSNPDNDVPAMREFAATAAPDAELVIPVQLEDVRRTVASARVVIGSRMHACLNALSVGTPAVPLAYSRKFEPLLADLGWAHTVDLRTAADPAADVLRELAVPDLADEVRGVVERAHAGLRVTEDALRAL